MVQQVQLGYFEPFLKMVPSQKCFLVKPDLIIHIFFFFWIFVNISKEQCQLNIVHIFLICTHHDIILILLAINALIFLFICILPDPIFSVYLPHFLKSIFLHICSFTYTRTCTYMFLSLLSILYTINCPYLVKLSQ